MNKNELLRVVTLKRARIAKYAGAPARVRRRKEAQLRAAEARLAAHSNGVTAAQIRTVAVQVRAIAAEPVKGPSWTVTMKDGSRFEIEAGSEDEARRVVRERLSVSRVPAGTMFAKVG